MTDMDFLCEMAIGQPGGLAGRLHRAQDMVR
jgi:hypothetical protein